MKLSSTMLKRVCKNIENNKDLLSSNDPSAVGKFIDDKVSAVDEGFVIQFLHDALDINVFDEKYKLQHVPYLADLDGFASIVFSKYITDTTLTLSDLQDCSAGTIDLSSTSITSVGDSHTSVLDMLIRQIILPDDLKVLSYTVLSRLPNTVFSAKIGTPTCDILKKMAKLDTQHIQYSEDSKYISITSR